MAENTAPAQQGNEASPALKDKYRVVGVVPGLVFYQGKEIDLRTISLAKAEKLAEDKNFPYLEKIQQDAARKTESKG